MEQRSTSLLKSSFIYGLYMALVSILLSVIIWAGSLMESLGMWGSAVIGLASLLISFILLIVFTKAYRNKELGGVITFGKAFQFGLLVVVFSTIIVTIYNYIFYTIIDPEYMTNLMAIMQEKTMAYMENAGVPESQMNRAMERFEEIPSTFKTLKQGVMYGIIGGAVLALISSAIVKKKEKPTEEIAE
jgi:uncharacterized membrane protein (DUF485 family)